MQEIAALIMIITLVCLAIQAYGIRKGIYDSSMAAWIIWTCIFGFVLAIYNIEWKDGELLLKKGSIAMNLFLGIQTIGHFGMIWITYKYVPRGFSPKDKKLLGIAIVGFIIWITATAFGNGIIYVILIGIIGQIVADATGAIAYIKIIKANPFRHPLLAWSINSFLYPITAYGIYLGKEEWPAYLFIGYAFVMYNALLIILIQQRRKKNIELSHDE